MLFRYTGTRRRRYEGHREPKGKLFSNFFFVGHDKIGRKYGT